MDMHRLGIYINKYNSKYAANFTSDLISFDQALINRSFRMSCPWLWERYHGKDRRMKLWLSPYYDSSAQSRATE